VRDAVDSWNNVQPNTFEINELATDNSQGYVAADPCQDGPYDLEENVIYLRAFSLAFNALTQACPQLGNGNIKYVLMSFNSDSETTWNTGTDDPTSGELDAEHIAAHEFGHFTGFNGINAGHFFSHNDCDQDPPIAYASDWQTMCDATIVLVGAPEEGKKFRRTLEAHDKHTFDSAY
jgi:hypothetical protein